jgi:2-polyprenyl-6-methoxyphenol hydroxylase-like FAD-dependent oxidoreductase
MYFMGLSATRFLKHWPELLKEYKQISLHNCWIETFKHSGEVVIGPKKVADRLRALGLDPDTPPGEFQMRPLVYKMFVNAVEKLGVSVEFNRKVVDYFEDEKTGKAGCTTDDGKVYEADVVIAADGVGSKSQKLVGGQVRARPSGRAMWRAAFPREALDKNQKVKEFFKMMPDDEPIVRTWLGPSTYALTLSREDVMVWIMNHDVRTPTPVLKARLIFSRSPEQKWKTGTTPSTRKRCSRAWTRCPVWRPSSGRPSSRSSSTSRHQTPLLTSSSSGETPSPAGLLPAHA